MKTFAGMPFEKAQEMLKESRKTWEDLEKNNPEEYKRQMQIADRWQAETDAMQTYQENESPD